MRTLIVENDFTCRKFLKKMIAPLSECEASVNGEEAVQAFQRAFHQNAFDLIIVNSCLPMLNGLNTLKIIRGIETRLKVSSEARVKVIMMAPLDVSPEIPGAMDEGMIDAYILKPVTVDKIMREIRSLGFFDSGNIQLTATIED